MSQMVMLGGLAAVLVLGLVFYPRATLGLMGSVVRGFFSLLTDAMALLLAWI